MNTLDNNPADFYAAISAQPEAQPSAGAKPPGLVIRGESHSPSQKSPSDIAHIDWFAFTHRALNLGKDIFYIKAILNLDFNIPTEAWKDTTRGWNGYKRRINLGEYGLMAFGGQSQNNTIHVELNAHGCALVQNWQDVHHFGFSSNSYITRIDLAHDDFEAKHVNIDICLEWKDKELFTSSGRPPKPKFIDDMGTGDGKTLYIGDRRNAKFSRMYEKGKQLGDPQSPWFRIELELKNRGILIPWEIVLSPGIYLAGAYKAYEYLSEHQEKLKTIQKSEEIIYDDMVAWVRDACGKAINAMLIKNDGDINAVIEQIKKDGVPKRLEPYFDSK